MRNKNEEFIVSQIGTPVFHDVLPQSTRSKTSMTRRMMSYLMLCAMGLNTTYVNQAWSQTSDMSSAGRRSAIIIPKEKPEAASSDMAQPESFESYQIRILRNQNHLQAEKIKQLREELMEVTQKLHELKPHLFRQGDPADKEKIAELTQQLGEKEESLTRLTTTKREMENEVTNAKKKLSELETVKEALAAMVEKQRVAKEQNLTNYKKQVEELKSTAQSEKNSLLRKIQQHESIQERLNQTLTEKGQTIQRLDTLSTQQDTQLKSKKRELDALESKMLSLYDEIMTMSSAFQAHQTISDEKIQSLTASLEMQQAHNKRLQDFKDEMKWISDLFDTTQDILKDEIQKLKAENALEKEANAELQLSKAELEQRRMELALLTSTHANYRSEMEDYIQNLVAAAEMEQTRTDQLEKQINVHLSHQEASHRYADALEGLLAQMDDLLTSKENELSKSQTHHGDTVGGMLMHLDHSDLAMDDYRNQIEQLKKQLETALAEHEEAESNWQTLQANLSDEHTNKELELQQKIQDALSHHHSLEELLRIAEERSNDLNDRLQRHTDAIADKESHINQLEENQSKSTTQFDQTVAELTEELEKQVKRASAAEMALQDAVLHMSRMEQELALNQDNLNERQGQLTALHDVHSTSKTDLHGQIEQLKEALEQEKQLAQLLKEELNHTLERHANETMSHDFHLLGKEEDINTLVEMQNMAKDELTARLAQLSKSYEEEQRKVWELQDQLLSLNSKYDEEQLQRAQQEQAARDLSKALDEKLQTISSLDGNINSAETHRKSIIDENTALLEKLANLQQKYLEEQDRIQLQNNLVEQLQADLRQAQETLAIAEVWKQQLTAAQGQSYEKDIKIQENLENIDQLRQDLQQLEKAMHNVQTLEQQLAGMRGQLSEKDATHQEQRAMIENLRQELQQLETATNNVQVLEQQLAGTREQLSEKDATHHEQRAMIDQLRKELQQHEMAMSHANALEQKLTQLESILTEKDMRISAVHEAAQQEKGSYAQLIVLLQQQLIAEKARTAELLNDLNYARFNVAQERGNLTNLEQLIQDETMQVANLREQLSDAQMALETKDLQFATLNEAKMLQKKNHIENTQKLREESKQEKAARIALEEALEKATALQQSNIEKARYLEHQVMDLQNQLKMVIREGNAVDQEQARAQTIQMQLSELTKQHEGLHTRSQQLENELDEMRQVMAQLTDARDQLTDQNQRLLQEKHEIEQRYLNYINEQTQEDTASDDDAGKSRLQRMKSSRNR